VLRFLTAGESHGQGLVVTLEGLPAGLTITSEMIGDELSRRRLGYGRGPRMRFERDEITLIGGVRHGKTLGSPLAILIGNTEWPKWEEEMSPAPGQTEKPLHQPRPGHADLAGMQKYDQSDARNILERASARETAARVAAGACAKAFLAAFEIEIVSHIVQMGAAKTTTGKRPLPQDLERVDESQVRCFDAAAEEEMIAEIKAAAKVGDSLGGAAEVLAYGVPVGLGSHIQWDRRLDASWAQALMSIQAIKAVEIGDGLQTSSDRGSTGHDAINWNADDKRYERKTSLAGGIEGGMSTGALLAARLWMKPLATLSRPVLGTVDTVTKDETVSFRERTDVTAVPAMGVVAETMTALVLAKEMLAKFGGDSMTETIRNCNAYKQALANGIGSA
jgi:chorismate synthase